MCHEKNFLKGPLNYLAVLPQNFSQIEKGIVGQKMLFFSRFDLVNCINPTFFAETCCTFMQLSWQKRLTYNTSSTSQLERGSTKEEGPVLLFILQRISSSPEMDGKGEKDEDSKSHFLNLRVTQNFTTRPGWARLNRSVQALGKVSKSMNPSQQRQREGQTTRKGEKKAHCSIQNGLSVDTVRIQRE